MEFLNKNFQEKNFIGKKYLRNALYSYFLWNSILIFLEKKHFIGVDSFNFAHNFNPERVIDWIYFFFWNPHFYHLVQTLMIVQSLMLLFGIIFNISNRVYVMICYLLTINVENMFISLLAGGDQISLIIFSLLPFINTSGKAHSLQDKKTINNFSIVLSETSFLLCKLHMATLYFSSVLYKLQGDLWLNGVAMYYIVQSDEFYHPFWAELIINSDFFITFTTYFTILWELSYPFLIWTRQCRLQLISIAIIFHLGTIFVMGLTTFGVAMIMLNLIFLTDKEFKFIKEKLRLIHQKVKKIKSQLNLKCSNKKRG